MGLVIRTNISALNTFNQLNTNNTQMTKSLQKLSSGYRINNASDDAAGLAISEKMRGQIRGLNQANANAQDANSLLQTADGALSETTSILQRMRELAVQSSSDTNTDADRANIQDEVNALVKQIDQIAYTTQFNTKYLLNGAMGSAVSCAVANVETNTSLNSATTTATCLIDLKDTAGNSLGICVGDTITIQYMKGGSLVTCNVTVCSGKTLSALHTADFALTNCGNGAILATACSAGTANAIYGLTITVKDASGNVKTVATDALSAFTQTTKALDARCEGAATILVGANTGQSLSISIDNMDAKSLGVQNIDVSSQKAANIAIKVIDTATSMVSAQRSKIGALENRLSTIIDNLTTSSQNMTAAESRIRDVDMASEMANYTKLSVLNQAATAMLAQANQLPQQVLTLLR